MRNTNSYFSYNADIEIRRSRWRAPYNKKFTMSAGKLYPFACIEVLPADTIRLPDFSSVTRMTTPIHPVMDNAYEDIYWFFVPNRLVMDDWKEFMGENTEGAWTIQQPDISMPMLTLSRPDPAGVDPKSVADYFGLPTWQDQGGDIEGPAFITSDYEARYQALPFRGYALIWNEWFRNQATHPPIPIYKDNISRRMATGYNTSINAANYKESAQLGGALCPVAKFSDYFVSALPAPQKGEDVLIGSLSDSFTQVYTDNEFKLPDGFELDPAFIGGVPGGVLDNNINQNGFNDLLVAQGDLYTDTRIDAPSSSAESATISNMGFRNNQIDITINQLRMAFQVQKFLEKQAMYGSRYTEMIRSFFGVTSPDSRLQRSEYIGGKRIPINMQQVLQTSATNDVTPQGNTAAFSLTSRANQSMFEYSATEHGFIIGVCCIRTSQTYQYGVRRMWTREDRLDYYYPTFANIGNTPIYNKELYQTFTDQDDEVFGYQEAWAEYRYLPSEIAGEFRSQYRGSLDSWHYAEKLTSLPFLGEEFIDQSVAVVDRTLAVSSNTADQFYCDFQMNFDFVRAMPVYSVPGLADHH